MHRLQELRGEPREEDPDALSWCSRSKSAAADGGQDQAVLTDLGSPHQNYARYHEWSWEVQEPFSPHEHKNMAVASFILFSRHGTIEDHSDWVLFYCGKIEVKWKWWVLTVSLSLQVAIHVRHKGGAGSDMWVSSGTGQKGRTDSSASGRGRTLDPGGVWTLPHEHNQLCRESQSRLCFH